ncbi:hypothetical protein GQ55_1G255600 [Panicum hallii var. hallii]|uniref:Uncharacterized protein n=1 Tax=Panicum hallii var. hallii TaxID=1504633 RepID=A0A2T7F7F1_9POAL|nr:hypothetical protein GQ55_1G255600 [Panicum hallii var. hallii]
MPALAACGGRSEQARRRRSSLAVCDRPSTKRKRPVVRVARRPGKATRIPAAPPVLQLGCRRPARWSRRPWRAWLLPPATAGARCRLPATPRHALSALEQRKENLAAFSRFWMCECGWLISWQPVDFIRRIYVTVFPFFTISF